MKEILVGYGIGIVVICAFDIVFYGITQRLFTMTIGELFILWGLMK